jgi:hypothetical protein
MIMDVTQEMYGIFNVETGELLRGPFKSVRGASNSRSAVIDTAIQTYMLQAGRDYHGLFMSWHRHKHRKDLVEFLFSKYNPVEVTDLLDACDRFRKQIQVRPVVVTMTMGELKD